MRRDLSFVVSAWAIAITLLTLIVTGIMWAFHDRLGVPVYAMVLIPGTIVILSGSGWSWWVVVQRRRRGKREYGEEEWAKREVKGGFCPECNYDLSGNVSGTCPECGTPTQ